MPQMIHSIPFPCTRTSTGFQKKYKQKPPNLKSLVEIPQKMTESARTCESPEARMITRGSIAEAWMPTLGTPHAGQTRSPRHAALPADAPPSR